MPIDSLSGPGGEAHAELAYHGGQTLPYRLALSKFAAGSRALGAFVPQAVVAFHFDRERAVL